MHGKDATFVHSLVSSLDRLERYVLALFYGEELTITEIGLVLDRPAHEIEATLRSLQSRARAAVAGDPLAGPLAS